MMDEDFEKKVTKRMAECAEAAVEELAARGEFIKCDSLCDAESVAVRCAKLALVRYETRRRDGVRMEEGRLE